MSLGDHQEAVFNFLGFGDSSIYTFILAEGSKLDDPDLGGYKVSKISHL